MIGSGNFVYFCKSDVSAVQGHPTKSAFMWLPISQ